MLCLNFLFFFCACKCREFTISSAREWQSIFDCGLVFKEEHQMDLTAYSYMHIIDSDFKLTAARKLWIQTQCSVVVVLPTHSTETWCCRFYPLSRLQEQSTAWCSPSAFNLGTPLLLRVRHSFPLTLFPTHHLGCVGEDTSDECHWRSLWIDLQILIFVPWNLVRQHPPDISIQGTCMACAPWDWELEVIHIYP